MSKTSQRSWFIWNNHIFERIHHDPLWGSKQRYLHYSHVVLHFFRDPRQEGQLRHDEDLASEDLLNKIFSLVKLHALLPYSPFCASDAVVTYAFMSGKRHFQGKNVRGLCLFAKHHVATRWQRDTTKMKFQFSNVKTDIYWRGNSADHTILSLLQITAECRAKVYLASRLRTLLGTMKEQRLVHLFDCDPIVLATHNKKAN